MNTVNNFVSYFNPFSDEFSNAVDGFRHDLSTTQRVATIAAAVIAGIFGLVISGFAVFRFTAEKWSKGTNETADTASNVAKQELSDQFPPTTDIPINTTGNDDSRASSSTDTQTPDENSDVVSSGTDNKGERSEDLLKSLLSERMNEIVSTEVGMDRLDKVASFIQFLSADRRNFENGQDILKMLAEVLSDFSCEDQLSLFGVFGWFDSKKTDSDENEWKEFIMYSLQLGFFKTDDEQEKSEQMVSLLEDIALDQFRDVNALKLALQSMTDEVRLIVTETLSSLDPKELDSDQEEWFHFMVGELFVDTMPVGFKLNKIKDEINQAQPGLFNHKGETSDHRRMKEYTEGYVKVMLNHMVDIVKEDPAMNGEKAQTHMKLFISILFPFYMNRRTEGLRSIVKDLVSEKKPDELELLINGFENSSFPLEALIAQDMNDMTLNPNQHIFMKAMLYVLFDEVNNALIAKTEA